MTPSAWHPVKRSRVIILFGTLTLSIVAYVAWCGRSFCLPKKLMFLSDDYPSEVRSQFEDRHGKTHIDLTAEFT